MVSDSGTGMITGGYWNESKTLNLRIIPVSEAHAIAMTNGFGGITGFMFLRTVFLKKAIQKKKSIQHLKIVERVIKMGCIGGSLAALLRGLFIAFIFSHVSQTIPQ